MCIYPKLHQCEISQNKCQWIRSLFELLFLVSLTKFSRAVPVPGSCAVRRPEYFLGLWLFSLGYFLSTVHGDKVPGATGSSAHHWVPALLSCSHLCICKDGVKQTSVSALHAGWFLCTWANGWKNHKAACGGTAGFAVVRGQSDSVRQAVCCSKCECHHLRQWPPTASLCSSICPSPPLSPMLQSPKGGTAFGLWLLSAWRCGSWRTTKTVSSCNNNINWLLLLLLLGQEKVQPTGRNWTEWPSLLCPVIKRDILRAKKQGMALWSQYAYLALEQECCELWPRFVDITATQRHSSCKGAERHLSRGRLLVPCLCGKIGPLQSASDANDFKSNKKGGNALRECHLVTDKCAQLHLDGVRFLIDVRYLYSLQVYIPYGIRGMSREDMPGAVKITIFF